MKGNTTTRLRAFARALDRLSSHDIVKVVTAMIPDGSNIYDAERYRTIRKLNAFALQYADYPADENKAQP